MKGNGFKKWKVEELRVAKKSLEEKEKQNTSVSNKDREVLKSILKKVFSTFENQYRKNCFEGF